MSTNSQHARTDLVSDILKSSPFRWRASVSTPHSTDVHDGTLDGDPVLYMFIVLGGRAKLIKAGNNNLCGGTMFLSETNPVANGVVSPSDVCTYLLIELGHPPGSLRQISKAMPAEFIFQPAGYDLTIIRTLHQKIEDEINHEGIGSASTIGKLVDILFVECLRERAKQPNFSLGLLAALNDQRLSKAIQAMRDKLSHDWGLDKLAKVAGMSRAAFASSFKDVVGVPPLTYLLELRMTLAAELIRSEDITVSELATSLGYAHESAFYKAFKRVHGTSPRDFTKGLKRAALNSNSPL